MKKNRIRPLAICVFRNNDRILVAEGYDPVKKQTFYRPLGGGIEFGERAEDAVRREIREEIGAEIASLEYLFTLENIFTFNGKPGHEIVLIFDGQLADERLYTQDRIPGQETDGAQHAPLIVIWKQLDEFGPRAPLYPAGLLERLK